MFGTARHAPANRGVTDLRARAERLEQYEQWGNATRIDFPAVVGEELWIKHWQNHAEILVLMREAEKTVELIRARLTAASEAATRVLET